MEKRFKMTDEFNFFVKDETKRKILEVAEFVENYIKKKHPKVKFEIVLDYDGIDDDVVMWVEFERTSFKKGMEIVKDADKKVNKKFPDLPLCFITILAHWRDVNNINEFKKCK
jgi:hypothetical protein